MQPRSSPSTAHDGAVPHPDGAAGLGAELAAVVAGARRRAVWDGDRQTDTAHLLHALLEHDPEARAAVGGPQRPARLLGYPVQRSIGYGLRWQGSVEDSGAIPLVPPPPGPTRRSDRSRRPDRSRRSGGDPSTRPAAPGRTAPPSPPQVGTARSGTPRAGRPPRPPRSRTPGPAPGDGGAPRVSGTDLLAALVADPRSRAVEVLERAGVPARELPLRIEAVEAAEYADGGGAAC